MLYAYDEKSLARKSLATQEAILDEADRLAEAYVEIGLVYANRAARRGNRVSIVKAPYEVHDAVAKMLKERGFEVSEYGQNFLGNPLKLNAYCIKW